MDHRYNRHNRRKCNLKVHIVLVTKYRKQLLKDSIADDVKPVSYTHLCYYSYLPSQNTHHLPVPHHMQLNLLKGFLPLKNLSEIGRASCRERV